MYVPLFCATLYIQFAIIALKIAVGCVLTYLLMQLAGMFIFCEQSDQPLSKPLWAYTERLDGEKYQAIS